MNPPNDAGRRDYHDDDHDAAAALQARAERPADPAEETLPAEERAELAAYRALFAALREEEPEFALPDRFAEELAARLYPPRESPWEWFAPVALLAAGLGAIGAVPAARAGAQVALVAATPALDATALSLLAMSGLAVGALFLADRLIAPALGARAFGAPAR